MIRLYFELLKSAVARTVVCKSLGTDGVLIGTDGSTDSERLAKTVADLQLFAEQHRHTEMLDEIMHRLRIVKTNETDYDTELTSVEELCKLRSDDLEWRFQYFWVSWESVNEVSELMKFLILRWIDRPSNKFVLKNWIWNLVVTVMRVSIDQCWMQCHTIYLFAAWSDVMKLLPTSEVVYDCETLERLKTAVSEIPEKVASPDTSMIVAPCPTCNPDYDTNKIWDEKADTNK